MAPPLLAVPNVSEGRDARRIAALQQRLHARRDPARPPLRRRSRPHCLHPRGGRAPLREALLAGAEQAVETIDMTAYDGPAPSGRRARRLPARLARCRPTARPPAPRRSRSPPQIGGLGVPVFLYGELASRPEHAERAYFRNGGLAELWLRMEGGGLRPTSGPALPHRTAGVTLVTARPPLAAFNVELDSGDVELARAVAAGLRESGGGPARRAGDRPAALQRPHPGLDQRP